MVAISVVASYKACEKKANRVLRKLLSSSSPPRHLICLRQIPYIEYYSLFRNKYILFPRHQGIIYSVAMAVSIFEKIAKRRCSINPLGYRHDESEDLDRFRHCLRSDSNKFWSGWMMRAKFRNVRTVTTCMHKRTALNLPQCVEVPLNEVQ